MTDEKGERLLDVVSSILESLKRTESSLSRENRRTIKPLYKVDDISLLERSESD